MANDMERRRMKDNKGLSFSSCIFVLLAFSTVNMLPLKWKTGFYI
jgi:hypothetical protein